MLRASAPAHITGQLERAVDSIGVNIAEGYSRYSGKERARSMKSHSARLVKHENGIGEAQCGWEETLPSSARVCLLA
jgi:hypothetical protein